MAASENFHVGKKFSCFEELRRCKEMYEKSNLVNLTMRDARKLEHKQAPKRAENANKELRYHALRLACSYGGKKFKKRGDNKRDTE